MLMLNYGYKSFCSTKVACVWGHTLEKGIDGLKRIACYTHDNHRLGIDILLY